MKQKASTKNTPSRLDLVQTVKTPLGFFTLIVLIVEAILGITASFNQGTDRTYLILGMLFLLFILVIVVSLFAFFRPEALSGKRPLIHETLDYELQSLTPAQRVDKYRQLIMQETSNNLLLNFNIPENYKPEISTMEKYIFGFCYPEKWTFSKPPEQITYGIAVDNESTKDLGFHRNMNIVINDISGVNFKTDSTNMLEMLYKNSLDTVMSILSKTNLIFYDKELIFQGLSASRWRIDWTPQDENNRDLTTYQIVVADKDRKNLYSITFTTTKDDFEKSQRLFDNIANTFRI